MFFGKKGSHVPCESSGQNGESEASNGEQVKDGIKFELGKTAFVH